MKALLVVLLGFPVLTFAALGPAKMEKPDVLIIMPDQMRGDCMSAREHPVVRTPNLDKLAKEGALFTRAYTTCPSCIPARHSLLTGLYPATSGMVGFKGQPIKVPTLPQLLAENGYMTVLVGRNMHQVPETNFYGFQQETLGSTYISEDEYDKFLRQNAPTSGGIRNVFTGLGLTSNGWGGKAWPLPDKLHPTTWIVGQGREVIKKADKNRPLFLTASFYAPHPPLFPPKKYFDHYYKEKLPAPAHGDWVDWSALTAEGDKQGHRVRLEGEALRATQAGYFGLIEQLDTEIKPLIAEFKERSKKAHRPWVIIFCTDHGEMLGDNGYFRKCEPYEGSANIPFIVTGSPELGFKPGGQRDELVCLEDIMPTVLALAGVECPSLMDGRNLAPLLREEIKVTRPWLQIEHADCYSKAQAFVALTDGRLKYIWRPLDGSEQLFDLSNDPKEEHNLTPVMSHRTELEEYRNKMIQLLANRPEGFSDGKKLIAGRPFPPLHAKKDGSQ